MDHDANSLESILDAVDMNPRNKNKKKRNKEESDYFPKKLSNRHKNRHPSDQNIDYAIAVHKPKDIKRRRTPKRKYSENVRNSHLSI